MDFRRSGQLDERRRRVLRDELAQPADNETADAAPSAGSSSAKGPVRAYCPAVLAERQWRTIDLLPVRPLWLAVAILLSLTAVAAVECAHIYARTVPLADDRHLAALDATQRGSIASWFASLVLACGAVTALVTFGIRAHRVDDYRGKYRIWLWMAGALAWGSLDAATRVHDALGLGLALLAGQSASQTLAAACTISWLSVYCLLFGTLGIRLVLELWCSLPALTALAISGLLYLIASLQTLEMLPAALPLIDSVVRTSVLLLAHVSLASALLLNARHVYLDAMGRLKVHIDPDRKKQAKAKSRARLKVVKDDSSQSAARPAAEKETPAKTAGSDKPAAASPPLKFGLAPSSSSSGKAGAAIAKSAPPADYDEEEDDDSEEGDRLSRAERRRLKKQARRDGQRRAA